MHRCDFVEEEIKEEAVRDLINTCTAHFRKHKNRKMSLRQLDGFCEVCWQI